jgi:hypothetical protein
MTGEAGRANERVAAQCDQKLEWPIARATDRNIDIPAIFAKSGKQTK